MADGIGVEQNEEKAVEWYTKAAEQGDADVQNRLQMLKSTILFIKDYNVFEKKNSKQKRCQPLSVHECFETDTYWMDLRESHSLK